MSFRRKRSALWKWLAMAMASTSLIVIFACNSPFIPIPPPDPSFSQDSPSSEEWSVTMPPSSNTIGAIYYFYNSTLGSGVIQKASTTDGSVYVRSLQGRAGDNIYIHWERGTDSSSTICRPLGPGVVQMICQ
jgi:hypothetical protein